MIYSKRLSPLLINSIALFFTLLFLFPLVYAISLSFMPEMETIAFPPHLVPKKPTFENYKIVLSTSDMPVFRWFINSLIAALSFATLFVVISALAGYGLSRFRFRFGQVYIKIIVGALAIPGFMLLIPNYTTISDLGLSDNLLSIVLPGLGGTLGVFLLRQVMLGIPTELDEAAIIDGAGTFSRFIHVIVPLSKDSLIMVWVIGFMVNWNDYIWPLVVLFAPEKRTLPVGMATLQGPYVALYGPLMAGAMLIALPSILVFFFGSKILYQRNHPSWSSERMNNKVKDSIKIPRPEFPRPDRFRSEWINLNGYWRFSFEEPPKADSRKILVPFAWQSTLSGIADEENHPIGWYERSFTIPVEYEGKRIFIHFGAVDYKAEVWVNGLFVGEHEGGYTPFSFDITGLVQAVGRENILTVKVVDRTDPAQPRGKQAWTENPDRCWYVPSSGIWQSVWIEAVGKIAIERFFITPDIDRRLIDIELELDGLVSDLILETTIFFQGIQVVSHSTQLDSNRCRVVLPVREADYVDEIHHWTPENPWLYDIVFTLFESDSQLDRIQSYFAMRSIRSSGGRIWLNNRPLYQRLVLDQGYWKESLLTATDDQAFVCDITMIKKLGFNGVRMHQKIEDPRFYYWADKLGLLVWAELPSAYEFCRYEIENLNRDFLHFLSRDYNHPSIIIWVPFNESWGIRNVMTDARQQAVVKAF